MTNEGLKSMSARLNRLENKPVIQVSEPTNAFTDKMISVITSSLKDDMDKIKKHFEEGLIDIGVNISNVTLVDLVKIIPYTVTFIEKNIVAICKVIKQAITSKLKLATAVNFITEYVDHDEAFLEAWINHDVDMLYNRGKFTLKDTLVNTNKSEVSTPTGTISKSKSRKFFSICRK